MEHNIFGKNIVLMADVLAEPEIALYWHAERILSILKSSLTGVGLDTKIYPINFYSKNEKFNRDIFFMKSQLTFKQNFNRLVAFEEISNESLEYFNQFFNKNQVVIGWELQKLTTDILDSLGITWINIWLHPVRFLEDEIFLVQTSDPKIHQQLTQFQVDENSFYVNAQFIRTALLNKKKVYDLPQDSCVIFGQTQTDKTLRTAKTRLSLMNYKNDIESLCHRFENVYFVFHPLEKDNVKLKEFIDSFGKIKIIEANAYSLLSSPNLAMVAAISSSVCTEAYYFSKNALFFNQPICDIKAKDSYSVDKDIFSPVFWQKIFGLTPQHNQKFIFNAENQVRDILNAYYSYSIMEKR